MNNDTQTEHRRIADRFELTTRYADCFDDYGVETWRAVDTVLARELRAIVIPSDHPYRGAAIDAARRSALFTDPHVTAILYVVDNESCSVVFTEFPPGAPLAPVLKGEPLAEPVITSIVGETTSAINHARNRGLRHLQLSARNIYISDAGEVTLDGLAVLNALVGVNTDRLSSELDRDEVRGLIVFYAALLEGNDFPSDSSTHNDIVSRAYERNDLPSHVREVFGSEINGSAVASPADLLRMIVPWESVDTAALPGFSAHLERNQTVVTPVQSSFEVYAAPNTDTNVNAGEEEDAADDSSAKSEAATGAAIGSDNDDRDSSDTHLTPAWPSLFNDVGTADLFSSEFGSDDTSPFKEPEGESAEESKSRIFPTDSSVVSSILPSVVSSALSPELPSTLSSEPVLKVRGRSLHAGTIVLVAFAIAVLFALIVGMMKLFAPLDPVQLQTPDSTTSQEEETASSATNNDEEKPASPILPTISSVTFAPADANLQNDAKAARLFVDAALAADGKPETSFTSWYFLQPDLPESSQWGLVIELTSEAPVTNISIAGNSTGGNISWLNGTPDQPRGAAVTSSAMAATTTLTAAEPITTKYVVLWVDAMPIDATGQNRVNISEIALS